MKNRQEQSFENPDFNFPKTVIGNARPVLEKALNEGQPLNALKALLEICAAETSISENSADRCVALADSVAEQLDGPWRSMALLIGADIVRSVYFNDLWTYNRRSLPQNEMPEQMTLWDGAMFRTRICDMVEASAESSTGYLSESLSEFLPILSTDPKKANSIDKLTYGDFLNYKSLSLLSGFEESDSSEPVIPFAVISEGAEISKGADEQKKPGQRTPRITRLSDFFIRQWQSSLDSSSPAVRWMWFLNEIRHTDNDLISSAERYATLWEQFGNTDVAPVLLPYFASPVFANRIVPYLKANSISNSRLENFYSEENLYPISIGTALRYTSVKAVKEVVAQWEQAEIRWNIPSYILPDTPTEIRLTDRNLRTGFLVIIKLPEGMSGRYATDITLSDLKKLKKVAAIAFGSDSKLPFTDTLTVTLPPLETGSYTAFPSTDGSINGLLKFRDNPKYLDLSIFEVTGLGKFTLNAVGKRNEVFITSAKDGAPVPGATVKLDSDTSQISYSEVVKTGEAGSFFMPVVPRKLHNLRMKVSTDSTSLYTSEYVSDPAEREKNINEKLEGRIFFDRPIARPGDKVGFAAVIYTKKENKLSPAADVTVPFMLLNASYTETDSLTLKTDSFGRCEGEITIPSEGMLGRWRLRAILQGRDEWNCPESTISVEEYKNPVNILILDKPELPSDSELVIKGRVETYSGMPVADAKVNIDIETWSRWWFPGEVSGRFSTETVTGADGQFRICLSREGLEGTGFADRSYMLTARSVSKSGDTAEDGTFFALGNTLVAVPEFPFTINADTPQITLPVKVYDSAGTPRNVRLGYTMKNVSDPSIAFSGTFESPLLKLQSDSIPSGTYSIEFHLATGEEGILKTTDYENKIIIWRDTDTVPAGDGTLWIPRDQVIAEAGKDSVEVRFGSRYKDQKILCVVSDENGEISRRWITPEGAMTSVSVPVPENDSRIFVTFIAMRDFVSVTETVTVLPPVEATPLQLKVETFRDRLTSSTRETWRFRFTDGPKLPASEIPAMAVMTDKALEALATLNWTFSPRSSLRWTPGVSFRNRQPGSSYYSFSSVLPGFKTAPSYIYPTDWVYPPNSLSIRVRSLRMMKSSAVDYASSAHASLTGIVNGIAYADDMDMAAPDGMVEEQAAMGGFLAESTVEEAEVDSGENQTPESMDQAFREAECPVAFFKPMLTTDREGRLEIEFDVPDFNTTWQFNLMGYDERLETASLTLDAVSSKPVMVRTSLPRFVRTSDKVILTANAYNNSLEEISLGGRIEILDPATKKILISRKFKGVKTAPGHGCLFSLEWEVPANIEAVVVRAVADGAGHSDGEQAQLVILPSSTPVIESVPFWLSPDQNEFSIEVPSMNSGSSVTLLYCDNPAWYCLTTLPSLANESGKTLTSLIYAYYGNSIGTGLLRTYPDLRNGLSSIIESSLKGETDMLKSNLERNPELKAISSGSTPWVNSASAETARMASLGDLLDSEKSRNILNRLLTDIADLQASDGGMRWYPDAEESSSWCSGQTLLHFAMLDRFGYLPHNDTVKKIVKGTAEYCRQSILKDWKRLSSRNGDNDETLSSFLPVMTNFLYITTRFGNSDLLPKESSQFSKLADRSIRLLGNSWGRMNIYNKATAASLLAAKGKKETALRILESLSEFSITDPAKGMWFDNLSGGIFSPWNKLITTAQVLEAYSEILPSSQEIDKLRQWLLLQRQTENWGELRDAAELVQAVLSSGTSWTGKPGAFEIKAGTHTLLSSKDLPQYGEATVSLRPEEVSGKKLTVTRTPSGIAWGGIVSQYVAPLKDIKAVSSDGLSVKKSIFAMRVENGVESAVSLEQAGSLKVGDKVRILLTVDNDRDMEYVTLTDERSACLEPTEALSGIDVIDGRYMYREVRNTQTNFFISYLPKGRYQFSYDCVLTSAGTFSSGISTIQSQYAPQLTAHSAPVPVTVEEQ